MSPYSYIVTRYCHLVCAQRYVCDRKHIEIQQGEDVSHDTGKSAYTACLKSVDYEILVPNNNTHDHAPEVIESFLQC